MSSTGSPSLTHRQKYRQLFYSSNISTFICQSTGPGAVADLVDVPFITEVIIIIIIKLDGISAPLYTTVERYRRTHIAVGPLEDTSNLNSKS